MCLTNPILKYCTGAWCNYFSPLIAGTSIIQGVQLYFFQVSKCRRQLETNQAVMVRSLGLAIGCDVFKNHVSHDIFCLSFHITGTTDYNYIITQHPLQGAKIISNFCTMLRLSFIVIQISTVSTTSHALPPACDIATASLWHQNQLKCANELVQPHSSYLGLAH